MTTITSTAEVAAPPEVVPVRTERASSFGAWWTETMVFAARNVEHIKQIPEKLLDVTLQPLMFVLLFAYVFGNAIMVRGGSYREFIVAGILIQSLAFGLVGPATSIATDLTEGVVDRFRSLPVTRSAYLAGHYVAELAGLGLSMVVLLTAGRLVGWRPHTDLLHIGLGVLLLVAFASAMVWIGTLIGLMVRAPDAVMGIAFVVVFPLTFVSAAFVPMNSLPDALQWAAAWNPFTVMVGAIRQLFGNPIAPITKHAWPLEHLVLAAFLYCALLLVIAVPLAMRRYKARTTD
jgi:ABC transporter DrrB family efflux protein